MQQTTHRQPAYICINDHTSHAIVSTELNMHIHSVHCIQAYVCVYIGIGRATVKALVHFGAEVVAFSRTEDDLLTLKQEVYNIARPHTQ